MVDSETQKEAPEGLEDILGELAALDAQAEEPRDGASGESGTPPEDKPSDDLDDLLNELAAADAPVAEPQDAASDETAEPAEASPPDGLDDILNELTAADPPVAEPQGAASDEAAAPAEASPPDGLENMLNELAASDGQAVEPQDTPALSEESPSDDLSNLFDEVANPEDAAPDAAARPAKRGSKGAKFRPLARKLLPAAAAVAVLGLTNGLSYYLGTKSQSAHHGGGGAVSPPHVAKPAPPPVRGLDRYVGMTSDVRVDGKTIFQNEEIKAAIHKLDGGEDLQRTVEKASRDYTSVMPIERFGDLFRIYSCNKSACGQDNVKIYYNANSKRAAVCTTQPYVNGTRISYAFSRFGFREVPTCDGNPFPKGV